MSNQLLDYILRIRLPITVFVIVVAFTLTYFLSRGERDGVGYSPDQPIAFSHQLHAGQMGIDCQYCHTGVEKSRHASIPSVSTCMNCHTQARTDRPQIVKLKEFYDQGKMIPWKRVHKVPDYAYFNHSVHVNKGIQCVSCHGEVTQMVKIAQVNPFTMGACLDCHRNAQQRLPYLQNVKNGPEYCWACHR